MRITEIIHKKIAFTLAEMMVILTIMSVVMAATMPIITAPDNAVLSGEGNNDNLWAYGNASKTVSTPNFVAIGMSPTVNTKGVDSASLFINNRSDGIYKLDYDNASHILFTTSKNNTVYNAGRLYMGPTDKYNIAFGAKALRVTDNNNLIRDTHSTHNVALGTWAMGYHSGSTALKNVMSVAIGQRALYGNTSASQSVAIGQGALCDVKRLGQDKQSVAVGYFAGFRPNSGSSYGSTYIGYMAGYKNENDNTSYREYYNVNVGYQAGAKSKGDNVINIGTNAGFYSNNVYNANRADSSSNVINIGTNAGAMPYGITYNNTWQDSYSNGHVAIGNHALYAPYAGLSDVIAIGSFAGYNIRGDSKKSIFIGNRAGSELQQGNPHDMLVAIGSYAGYKNGGIAVAIGYQAGAYVGASTYAGAGRSTKHNNEKMMNEIAIGYKAGTVLDLNGGSYGNIFIGNRAGTNLNANTNGDLINSICLGNDSCPEGTTGIYSLFIGEYAGASPTTSSLTKKGSFSIVTTEWPKPVANNVNTGIDNSLFKSVVHYTDNKADQWGQMILAPAPKYYSSSRITLDATTVYAPTSNPLTYSDIRLKKNIKPLKYSLDTLKGVNIYEYNYINEPSERRIGVIAQDLLKLIPEAVVTSDKGYYTVNPEWVFYPIINAIKELDKSVQTCKATLVAYAKEYNNLNLKMKTLEKEQKQLEKERKSLERQINKAYRKAEKMEKSA